MNKTIGGVLVVVAMAAWACGSDDTPAAGAPGSGTCSADDPATTDNEAACKELANAEDGAKAVEKRACGGCHGADMSGSTEKFLRANVPTETALGDAIELYPPNLTTDPTGVGGPRWTDAALVIAIRQGIDDESQALCPQMQHFSNMTDFEAYSIVAYLRSIPKVAKAIPRSVCPPTKTKEQQSLPR